VEVSACTKLGVGVLGQRSVQRLRIDRPSPLAFHRDHLGAGAPGHLRQSAAEHAVDTDHRLVARLQQVHHAGLLTGGGRPRNRQREFVDGVEQTPQRGLDLVHQTDEFGVEMADGRARQGLAYARVNVRGPRPHQDTGRRLKTAA
jgi:hypothetical protein